MRGAPTVAAPKVHRSPRGSIRVTSIRLALLWEGLIDVAVSENLGKHERNAASARWARLITGSEECLPFLDGAVNGFVTEAEASVAGPGSNHPVL